MLANQEFLESTSISQSHLPSILVISVPKSGTIFINRRLTYSLGLANYPISLGYFPRDLIDWRKIAQFAQGGYIDSEHLDPSRHNLQILDAFSMKWVVHIRDPRSVVVSWTYHLDRYLNIDKNSFLNVYPTPPSSYFSCSFEDKISWNIYYFLPSLVSWINDWMVLSSERSSQILLTSFDELADSEDLFFERILDFYGCLDKVKYHNPTVEKSMESTHFRNGRKDEWREAFTSAQLKTANQIIGDANLERFNWSRN